MILYRSLLLSLCAAVATVATPALIVPGKDESHATSAARYLEECLSKSRYWDVPPERQTEQERDPDQDPRILEEREQQVDQTERDC